MVSTDPISDMLTRIRNAISVRKTTVMLPHSKIKEAIADILKEHKYITGYEVVDARVGKDLILTINNEHENARITELKRISTPGRRSYTTADKIPNVKQGRGIVIVSTSRGLLTGRQAKASRVGGELICEVY